MEEKILIKYRNALSQLKKEEEFESFDTNEQDELENFDTLQFKYHLIRFNCRFYAGLLNESIPYFRKILHYEVLHNLDFDYQYFLWSFKLIDVIPSPRNVKRLTDKQIIRILNLL